MTRGQTWIPVYLLAYFGSLGISFIYFQVYLHELDYSYGQIGLFSALIPLVALFTSPLWGVLADSQKDPRKILRLLLFLGPLSYLLLVYGHSLAICFLLCILLALFQQPIIPIHDSLILRSVHRDGGDYGRFRIWGSIGFIIPALFLPLLWGAPLAGKINWTVPAIAFFAYAVLAFLASLRFPEVPPEHKHRLSLEGLALLKNRTFLVLMGCVFLSRWATAGLEAYQPIYLQELGVPLNRLALFLILGPVSEIVTIYFSQTWMMRSGARFLMILCFVAQVIRLLVTASTENFGLLVLVQSLHCLTFGTQYVVAVLVVNQLAGDHIRSSAQTLAMVFTNYLARLSGFLFSGWIADRLTIPGLFRVGALVTTVALLLWMMFFKDESESDLHDGIH